VLTVSAEALQCLVAEVEHVYVIDPDNVRKGREIAGVSEQRPDFFVPRELVVYQ